MPTFTTTTTTWRQTRPRSPAFSASPLLVAARPEPLNAARQLFAAIRRPFEMLPPSSAAHELARKDAPVRRVLFAIDGPCPELLALLADVTEAHPEVAARVDVLCMHPVSSEVVAEFRVAGAARVVEGPITAERLGDLLDTAGQDGPTVVAGRYALGDRLGEGATADVWAAVDRSIGTEVAIKLLVEDADAATRRRFRREVRLVRRLRHPLVVPVWDYGVWNHRPFFTMERLEGETLAARLARRPLSPAAAARLVRRVASVLKATHAQGIVHLDLKPDNLLLTRRGDLRLLDFGAAQEEGDAPDAELVGTPGYVAPERLAAPRSPANPRMDLFALGVVFFEALTGAKPFDKDSLLRVPLPGLVPSDLAPRVPAALDELVLALLRDDPERRIPSAQDFIDRLEGIDLFEGVHRLPA